MKIKKFNDFTNDKDTTIIFDEKKQNITINGRKINEFFSNLSLKESEIPDYVAQNGKMEYREDLSQLMIGLGKSELNAK